MESDVKRDMTGETVCGFRVAAWRETRLIDGEDYGHRYSEHWSTPSKNPAVTVERLFTEAQLRDALSRTSSAGMPEPEAVRARLEEFASDGWSGDAVAISVDDALSVALALIAEQGGGSLPPPPVPTGGE